MIRSISVSQGRAGMPGIIFLLSLLLLILYYFSAGIFLARSSADLASGISFPYQQIGTELEVDWSDGGDFDPRDKCPKDFFTDGFVLLCKKLKDGKFFKFLYHKKKKLLYRIDKDVIQGKAKIGLHWVESTRFNAKYRIADPAFKGGKVLKVPNAKGNWDRKKFDYGQAVSKKRVQRRRELFHQTHLDPKPCQDWWELFDFVP